MTLGVMKHLCVKVGITVHVQNVIAGPGVMFGQHSVIGLNQFREWVAARRPIIEWDRSTNKCPCGLRIGEVRNHDGHIWKREDVTVQRTKRPRTRAARIRGRKKDGAK